MAEAAADEPGDKVVRRPATIFNMAALARPHQAAERALGKATSAVGIL